MRSSGVRGKPMLPLPFVLPFATTNVTTNKKTWVFWGKILRAPLVLENAFQFNRLYKMLQLGNGVLNQLHQAKFKKTSCN